MKYNVKMIMEVVNYPWSENTLKFTPNPNDDRIVEVTGIRTDFHITEVAEVGMIIGNIFYPTRYPDFEI